MNSIRERASCCDRWPWGDIIYNVPSVPALLETMFLIAGHGFNFNISNSLENTDLFLATTMSIISQVNRSANFSFSLGDSWTFHLLNRFDSIGCGSIVRHILICSSDLDNRTTHLVLLSFKDVFNFCLCVGVFAWMYLMHLVYLVPRGEMRVLDPLELSSWQV